LKYSFAYLVVAAQLDSGQIQPEGHTNDATRAVVCPAYSVHKKCLNSPAAFNDTGSMILIHRPTNKFFFKELWILYRFEGKSSRGVQNVSACELRIKWTSQNYVPTTKCRTKIVVAWHMLLDAKTTYLNEFMFNLPEMFRNNMLRYEGHSCNILLQNTKYEKRGGPLSTHQTKWFASILVRKAWNQ